MTLVTDMAVARRRTPPCTCAAGGTPGQYHSWACKRSVWEPFPLWWQPSYKAQVDAAFARHDDKGGGVLVWRGPVTLSGLSDHIGRTTVTKEEWVRMTQEVAA